MPQAWLVEIKKLFSKLPLDAAEDEKRPGTSALPVRQAIARRWREIRDTCKGTVKELHKLRRGLCDQLHQLVQSYMVPRPPSHPSQAGVPVHRRHSLARSHCPQTHQLPKMMGRPLSVRTTASAFSATTRVSGLSCRRWALGSRLLLVRFFFFASP